MAEKYLEIVNNSGNVILDALTQKIVMIKKGGSAPSGTLFTAYGQSTNYHFGYPSGSGSNYGMKCWDANGKLIFDAVNYSKMAVVVDTIGCTLNVSNDANVEDSTTKTMPSGRTYAVYIHQPMSAFYIRNVPTKIGSQFTYRYAMDDLYTESTVSGRTVKLTCRRSKGNPLGTPSGVPYTSSGWTRATASILDVTNF